MKEFILYLTFYKAIDVIIIISKTLVTLTRQKLVNETFQSMWFSPCRDKDSSSLLQKVLNITEVASIASTSIGFEWLERLMENVC